MLEERCQSSASAGSLNQQQKLAAEAPEEREAGRILVWHLSSQSISLVEAVDNSRELLRHKCLSYQLLSSLLRTPAMVLIREGKGPSCIGEQG